MTDDSEVEGNILWRKVFGSKRKPKYWYAHAVLIPFFGFMTLAASFSIVVEGYEMRPEDWAWFVLYWLGMVGSVADLWWQWRKRKSSASKTEQTES
ncbi:MAG: hypothetical protein ACFFD6_08470 [Candidatus Thorarchaeota archaeon]